MIPDNGGRGLVRLGSIESFACIEEHKESPYHPFPQCRHLALLSSVSRLRGRLVSTEPSRLLDGLELGVADGFSDNVAMEAMK